MHGSTLSPILPDKKLHLSMNYDENRDKASNIVHGVTRKTSRLDRDAILQFFPSKPNGLIIAKKKTLKRWVGKKTLSDLWSKANHNQTKRDSREIKTEFVRRLSTYVVNSYYGFLKLYQHPFSNISDQLLSFNNIFFERMNYFTYTNKSIKEAHWLYEKVF